MAFTTSDLTAVEAAIVSLATGTQAVQVNIADKLIRYAETDLDKLRALRGMIQTELGSVYTRVYARNGGRSS